MAETGNELSAPKNLWLPHWLVSQSQVLQNLSFQQHSTLTISTFHEINHYEINFNEINSYEINSQS